MRHDVLSLRLRGKKKIFLSVRCCFSRWHELLYPFGAGRVWAFAQVMYYYSRLVFISVFEVVVPCHGTRVRVSRRMRLGWAGIYSWGRGV